MTAIRTHDQTLLGTIAEHTIAGVQFVRVTTPDNETMDIHPNEIKTMTSLSESAAKAAHESHTASLGRILNAVCEFYGVALVDVIGPRRHARTVRARHVGMHLGRRAGYPSQAVSAAFQRVDHGTALFADKRIRDEMQGGARLLAGEVGTLRKLLNIREA